MKGKRSVSDVIYDALSKVTPNCSDALRLVELGQKRSLTLREKWALTWNSPLCLHCNCKREQFEEERLRMVEMQKASQSEPHEGRAGDGRG